MAAFLKEYFCGVPVLAGWVYAFCGSMSRNSRRLVLKIPNLEIIYYIYHIYIFFYYFIEGDLPSFQIHNKLFKNSPLILQIIHYK